MSIVNYIKSKISDIRKQLNVEPYNGDFDSLKSTIVSERYRYNPPKPIEMPKASPIGKRRDLRSAASSFSSQPTLGKRK